MKKEQTFRFNFIGRQYNAIGQFNNIFDTYKAQSLGHALFMLHTDYLVARELKAFDTSNMRSMFDSFEDTRVPDEVLKTTELKSFKYPKRETSPNTGTYRYYRSDAPDNYKW
ncbi:MAG: hypothetical protein IT215_01135 [Chitinophagaceae bacterium]|nr:hypothetical protein [Chitinophagaceae bacterium]